MKISVIIPTYRPKAYLWECLKSLSNQTFSKEYFEVILVLNGCNEPYNGEIQRHLEEYNDLNVKYIKINEGGVSIARNRGLDEAKGEYITFIDDDDYVSPAYLEKMYEASDGHRIALSNTLSFKDGSDQYDSNYVIHRAYTELKKKNRELNVNSVRKYLQGPCRSFIHRDIIGSRRFNRDFKNGEDSLFMFLISDRMTRFQMSDPNATYYRRIRSDSATNVQTRQDKWVNAGRMIAAYISIYLRHPFRYNVLFFITRLLGTLHSLCEH